MSIRKILLNRFKETNGIIIKINNILLLTDYSYYNRRLTLSNKNKDIIREDIDDYTYIFLTDADGKCKICKYKDDIKI